MQIEAKFVNHTNPWLLVLLLVALLAFTFESSHAQELAAAGGDEIAEAQPKQTKEPVFRVSKLNREKTSATLASSVAVTDLVPKAIKVPSKLVAATPELKTVSPAPVHPLDAAIKMAEDGLVRMRANISDYTAILVKRERLNGTLSSPSYMRVKIRCPRDTPQGHTPFSVYMKFLKPRNVAGREVIWVDGQNDNKLCVHETGLMGMKRFYLDPNGWLAMQGNKYPIYDVGLENLMIKLIEKAERDKAAGTCEVNYRQGVELMKRSCSVIELVHAQRQAPYDFHKAQVFIDDELNMPVRFVSYDWPTASGATLDVLEEYTYVKVAINQGFTDIDFSPENPAYKYPAR